MVKYKYTSVTYFYVYPQNNSGGFHLKNEKDGIGEILLIEAINAKIANSIMERIVRQYNEYCPCCGERWEEINSLKQETDLIIDDQYGDKYSSIEKFCESNYCKKSLFGIPTIYIHYSDSNIDRLVLECEQQRIINTNEIYKG